MQDESDRGTTPFAPCERYVTVGMGMQCFHLRIKRLDTLKLEGFLSACQNYTTEKMLPFYIHIYAHACHDKNTTWAKT